MSYDFPDDYVHPPPPRTFSREWFARRWWSFVIWCALDARSRRLNDWGLRILTERQ